MIGELYVGLPPLSVTIALLALASLCAVFFRTERTAATIICTTPEGSVAVSATYFICVVLRSYPGFVLSILARCRG